MEVYRRRTKRLKILLKQFVWNVCIYHYSELSLKYTSVQLTFLYRSC
nr:MAG TPA: SCP-A6 peptide, lipopolysaccharide, LBP14, Antibacterial [Caudoviricetes sp.]